ncbi:MAG TPA: DUF4091 domain-containing protein [Polyangia bacterium]|jgi:hypothetical protein|nr:DUF4091 domain-containing protein [Polyangia bacterium]
MQWERMVRTALLLGVVCGVAPEGAAGAAAGPEVFALSSLVTVRPWGTPRGGKAAMLEAARGEWESFQVVVRAGPRALPGVTVSMTPLVGPGKARIEEVRVYRVGFVSLDTPSNVEGATGPWPDPLIPARDAYAGEERRAFPVAVPARHDAAAWIDVFVPPTARPGRYRGEVRVQDGDRLLGRVPVTLEVHRFTLPATSSLPVTFGFALDLALRGHFPAPEPRKIATDHPAQAADELWPRYALAALRHRISLHGGSCSPPDFVVDSAGEMHLDFGPYDREVGPFLDGTADRDGPAAGARWSTLDLRVPARLQGEARTAYVRAMVRHLGERRWLDRVFDYTIDEPSDAQLGETRRRAAVLREATLAVPRLVTHPLHPDLLGAVDIWCPVVNRVDDKPDGDGAPGRAAYEERLGQGERLWWYQSCMSHGCDIVGGSYFTGWPSLVIDSSPVQQRILEWLSFRYRMGGELYYNTIEAYDGDPWRTSYRHGGNGDGTLFYPGRPEVIGGQSHIPIESIRLKRIRDGLEDYEYLHLYEARAGFAAADALARRVAERTYRFRRDPRRLLDVRHELARRLDAAPEQITLQP